MKITVHHPLGGPKRSALHTPASKMTAIALTCRDMLRVSMGWRIARVAALTAACLSAAVPAIAQVREGLIGGISVGGTGLLIAGESDDPAAAILGGDGGEGLGLGVSLFLGAMGGARSALLFEMAVAESGSTPVDGDIRLGTRRVTALEVPSWVTSTVLAMAFQYWLTSRGWVRVGVGGGALSRDWESETGGFSVAVSKQYGLALLGAAGVDLWQRGNFGLSADFRITSMFLSGLRVTAPGVQVGFSWY